MIKIGLSGGDQVQHTKSRFGCLRGFDIGSSTVWVMPKVFWSHGVKYESD